MKGRFELPSRPYDAFIFDCDGTLADSMPLHHDVWRRVLARNGARFDFSWELFMSRAGMTVERTIEELNLQFGLHLDPVRVSAEQRLEYEAGMSQITAIEPVLSFAREAALAGHRVSVASGGEAAVVRRTLEIIGSSSLFDVVVTSAEVAHGKPAPDLFLLAAERMGAAPATCLVFEDSELGIVAAKRAGMGSVLVNSGR